MRLKPPAEPARLPFAAELTWQRALRSSLAEGVASLADFLGQTRRPSGLAPPADYEDAVDTYPSHRVGSERCALFEVGDSLWQRTLAQQPGLFHLGIDPAQHFSSDLGSCLLDHVTTNYG